MKSIARALLVVSIAAFCTPALANPDGDRNAAKALVNAGNELFRLQQYAAALEKYEAAFETYSSPKIRLNLAETLRQLGRNAEASSEYRRFLLEADLEQEEELETMARSRIADLQLLVGRIEVTGEPGATVSVDGTAQGDLPLEAPVVVDPGRRELEVTKDGFSPFRQAVMVQAAQTTTVEALLTAEPPPEPKLVAQPAPVVTASPQEDGVYEKWWFWAAVGGAAVAVVGIGVAASSGGDDFVPSGELPETSTADWMRF